MIIAVRKSLALITFHLAGEVYLQDRTDRYLRGVD